MPPRLPPTLPLPPCEPLFRLGWVAGPICIIAFFIIQIIASHMLVSSGLGWCGCFG